jgi:hypothetical protein
MAASATTPSQTTVSSSMSQDVITSNSIIVDTTSVSPVAPFLNPASAGLAGNEQIEALALIGGQVNHVARNAASDSGWQATPPFTTSNILEVAGGTAFAASASPAVWGFFHDGTGVSYTSLESDGITWSSPQPLTGSLTTNLLATNLKVAYTYAGQVVLYGCISGGASSGNLLLAYPDPATGGFSTTVVDVGGNLASGDFSLCMTGGNINPTAWSLAVNVNGTPTIYTGTLTSTEPDASQTVSGIQLQQVALSFYSYAQNTLMFLFVDTSGQLHVWALSSQNQAAVVSAISNTLVATASGVVDTSGCLHVYFVDTTSSQVLWVLHQDSQNPWNSDLTPNWATCIPLDDGVADLATDMNPVDGPTLFVTDAADGSLRLHTQGALQPPASSPQTQMWSSGQLLQSSQIAYEVSRFRTEINVLNAYGTPLASQAVSVQVAPNCSAVELWVAGKIYPIDSQTPATLYTDARGKLTFATLMNTGLATPNLIIMADGLPNPVTVVPSAPLHTYFSGSPALLNPTNPSGPLPQFTQDGAALQNATNSQNQPLAPNVQNNSQLAYVAANAIQQTALLALNQVPSGTNGYSADFNNQTFQTYPPGQPPTALVAGLAGDVGDDLENWAGDIWQGIKNGVATITSFVVDTVNKVITLAIQLGTELNNYIVSQVTIAIDTVEKAAHAIEGVFQIIGAEVEDVIDWLKAVFDFSAIWNTMTALNQANDGKAGLPPVIQSLVQMASSDVGAWFLSKEEELKRGIRALKKELGAQTLSQAPNFQTPGQPPDSTTPVAGNATVADFNNNVHHNWLNDKLNAYAPAQSPVTAPSGLQTPWQQFSSSLQNAQGDFLTAIQDFSTVVKILATDPSQIGTLGIGDLLDGIEKMIDAALNLCNSVAQGFLGVIDSGIDGLVTMLGTALSLGPINLLWEWMAPKGSDTPLTLGSLLSLIAAFPCTVIYKLVQGASEQPFPDGTLPVPASGGGNLFPTMPVGCQMAADILQILYFVPAAVGDVIGNGAPWFLTLTTVTLTAAMFVLNHGVPQLTITQWSLVWSSAELVALVLPLLGLMLCAVWEQLKTLINAISADLMNVAFTVYGVLRFVFDAVDWVVTQATPLVGFSGLLLPLPTAFSWLKLSAYRADEEWGAFCQIASLLVDMIGYVGGGMCELGNTLTATATQPRLAATV